jgi:virulence surface antigen
MATREIRKYKQGDDGRWYAGEVKPALVGVGAYSKADFEATATSDGACFGLSIWWIIKNATRQNFWSWMVGAGPQVAEIKSVFLLQRGEHDFSRFDHADQKIRLETGMTRQNKTLMKEGTDFKHTGYHYISLRGKFGQTDKVSGHAIAAYFDADGMCRYFDPNFGEFETDTMQEALVELNKLVRGYRIRSFKIYWCCWK